MLNKYLQYIYKAKEKLLKQKQLNQLEYKITNLKHKLLTREYREYNKDNAIIYPTDLDTKSVIIELKRDLSKETISYRSLTIKIISKKHPIYN